MRVAAIDIGTNTVLLLVAELVAEGGELRAVEERATITRLGEGVDATRRLAPAAIERTCACLEAYADVVRSHGIDANAIDVVGTSAMRDAAGGEAIRTCVRAKLGVEARVVSGHEEALLTFAGAVSGLTLPAGDVAVFDIGGGSTEIVRGTLDARGRAVAVRDTTSIDIGSVRLTERHVRSDPPSNAELDAVRADVARALAAAALARRPSLKPPRSEPMPPAAGPGEKANPAGHERAPAAPQDGTPIGIAGTMTTLTAVALGLRTYDGARVHGHVLSRDAIARVVETLARTPLDERRNVAGLEPKRADVIVAGGLVALGVLDALGAREVRVSDRGVRWGLAERLARGGSGATV